MALSTIDACMWVIENVYLLNAISFVIVPFLCGVFVRYIQLEVEATFGRVLSRLRERECRKVGLSSPTVSYRIVRCCTPPILRS